MDLYNFSCPQNGDNLSKRKTLLLGSKAPLWRSTPSHKAPTFTAEGHRLISKHLYYYIIIMILSQKLLIVIRQNDYNNDKSQLTISDGFI